MGDNNDNTQNSSKNNNANWWGGWSNKIAEGLQTAAQATKLTLQTAADITKEYIGELQIEVSAKDDTPPVDPSKAPWILPSEFKDKESFVKKQILLLSEEKWNFLTPPSEEDLSGWNWELDIEAAKFCLQSDKKLEKMRFLLVPYKVKEEMFWKNYFSRIHILKKAILDPNVKFTHKKHPNPKPREKRYDEGTENLPLEDIEQALPKIQNPPQSPLPARSVQSEEPLVNNVEVKNDSPKISKESKEKFELELMKELKDIEDEIDLELGGFEVGDIDITDFNEDEIQDLLGD